MARIVTVMCPHLGMLPARIIDEGLDRLLGTCPVDIVKVLLQQPVQFLLIHAQTCLRWQIK